MRATRRCMKSVIQDGDIVFSANYTWLGVGQKSVAGDGGIGKGDIFYGSVQTCSRLISWVSSRLRRLARCISERREQPRGATSRTYVHE